MKVKFKKILIFVFLLTFLLIFIKLSRIETVTGEFALTKSFFPFLLLFFTFLIVFLLVGEATKENTRIKFHRLLGDLFEYSDKVFIGRREEYRNHLNETAKEFVNFVKELAKDYKIQLIVLNSEDAEEKLLGFISKIYDIKHRKVHKGAEVVYEMRENPHDLSLVRAGLKFLMDLKPQVYGNVARDLYYIVKKL